jgi:hypothetical protein
MNNFNTVQVVDYCIMDGEKNFFRADNNRSFDDTNLLLQQLREKDPLGFYIMYAEINA